MTKFYVEQVRAWWNIDAASEDEAISIARDGLDANGTDDWYAESAILSPLKAKGECWCKRGDVCPEHPGATT